MISCNNEVMTPCRRVSLAFGAEGTRVVNPTERVPEDQGKLGYLFSLLAQL